MSIKKSAPCNQQLQRSLCYWQCLHATKMSRDLRTVMGKVSSFCGKPGPFDTTHPDQG